MHFNSERLYDCVCTGTMESCLLNFGSWPEYDTWDFSSIWYLTSLNRRSNLQSQSLEWQLKRLLIHSIDLSADWKIWWEMFVPLGILTKEFVRRNPVFEGTGNLLQSVNYANAVRQIPGRFLLTHSQLQQNHARCVSFLFSVFDIYLFSKATEPIWNIITHWFCYNIPLPGCWETHVDFQQKSFYVSKGLESSCMKNQMSSDRFVQWPYSSW